VSISFCTPLVARGKIIRPITTGYDVCLVGMDDFTIKVNTPVDEDIASLIYKGVVIGRFDTGIIAPAYKLSKDDFERWQKGEIVVVKDDWGWLGIKKTQSVGEGYPNVYVRLDLDAHNLAGVSGAELMQALGGCNLKSDFNHESPPKIGAHVPN